MQQGLLPGPDVKLVRLGALNVVSMALWTKCSEEVPVASWGSLGLAISRQPRLWALESSERKVSSEGLPRSDWPVGVTVRGCLDFYVV